MLFLTVYIVVINHCGESTVVVNKGCGHISILIIAIYLILYLSF